jgi:hypothetical protein
MELRLKPMAYRSVRIVPSPPTSDGAGPVAPGTFVDGCRHLHGDYGFVMVRFRTYVDGCPDPTAAPWN